ncbi:MAG: hypothetical protein U9Q37_05945 [Euryarchaeota archaeon]|nr:hypothetical protein [Euryarchaeota archaeon]
MTFKKSSTKAESFYREFLQRVFFEIMEKMQACKSPIAVLKCDRHTVGDDTGASA